MAIQFGRTWWGQQWLQALSHVDNSNRLPRGASYARAGHVLSMEMMSNSVEAKVQGSMSKPYQIHLKSPLFDNNYKKVFINKLIARPAIISQLFNRILAPEILTIARDSSLKVFPQKWSDIQMRCSCPDSAVPCKHIAAVIYKISQEIDMNPFLVLEMHGLDLIDELANQGIILRQQKNLECKTFESLIQSYTEYDGVPPDIQIYEPIDLSLLSDLSLTIPKLLPDSPVFYNEGNFRERFEAIYNACTKEASKILSGKTTLASALGVNTPSNLITFKSELKLSYSSIKGLYFNTMSGEEISSSSMFAAIMNIDKDRLNDYDPTTISIYKIILAALHFIAKGSIIPQLFNYQDNQFIITWLPSLIDAEARKVVKQLEETILPGILVIERKEGKKVKSLFVSNQAYIILSMIIDHFIHQFKKPLKPNPLTNFFFYQTPSAFKSVGQESVPGSVSKWLECLHINTSTIKPVFEVNIVSDRRYSLDIQFDGILPEGQRVSLRTLITDPRFISDRFKAIQILTLLTAFIPNLEEHINLEANESLTFGSKTFAWFLTEMIPAIRVLGLKVILPRALETLLRPKRTMSVSKSTKSSQGFIRLDDLLQFQWQIAIGDHRLTQEEFNKLLNWGETLFRFKQEYFYINDMELVSLKKSLLDKKSSTPGQLLQAVLSGEFEGTKITLTPEVEKLIKDLTIETQIGLPTGLKAKLRPYQERGYSWMYRNARIGFGSIIADDMGLGKTLQVIALLAKLKEESVINTKKRVLIVMPTGLLTNWRNEIMRFAPGLTCELYHGVSRDIKEFKSDIMLTTYGIMRSDYEALKRLKWHILVIDEAQNIKNHDTAQTKALKAIPADIRIAMSGTPVENRLEEFWSIMDFVNKGYLGNTKSFRSEYSIPIQIDNDAKVIERFKKVTSPFIMRRMKSDKSIITDLPDKIEMDQLVTLTGDQAALYQQTLKEAMKEISGITDSDSKSLFKRQGLVLQMILALKQICNHPTQFLKDGQTDGMLSGKIQLLYDLLDSILEVNEKVLIFTQFKEMGDLLVRFIKDRYHEEPLFYHGGCSVKQREELIERFQKGHRDNIFILSLKAAGTGLNLTAASHVIHYDLWWNPAVENQATDRAYRIGQHKNVMVHRLICSNTFEEKINEMIRKKRDLAEMTVATGENWIGKMSNSELEEIFRP